MTIDELKHGRVIPICEPHISSNAWQYVQECLESGWVSPQGHYVHLFEEQFAAYVGTKYAIATHSGTAALHLALVALGIGPGDEVVVPALTFIATANAVTYTGAEPVFIDSEAGSGTLDPALLEALITPRTRAIMPVHLYGHPANMEMIQAIAQKYQLAIVEDAASALGSRYQDRHVGTFGDCGCFSFYANKLITTGAGGMLVTDSTELMERADRLSRHAFDQPGEYFHSEVGHNHRLSALQAALGLAQLEQVEHFLQCKQRNARLYNHWLASVPGIIRPSVASDVAPSYGFYTIQLTKAFPLTALELRVALWKRGIETRPYFVPLKDLPPYQHCRSTPLPQARTLRETGVCLPSSVKLTPTEIEFIASTICELGEMR